MELEIRREKETGLQALPDQDRGLFVGTLPGITIIQRLRISDNMVTPNIHSTRERQKANTRGMGA